MRRANRELQDIRVGVFNLRSGIPQDGRHLATPRGHALRNIDDFGIKGGHVLRFARRVPGPAATRFGNDALSRAFIGSPFATRFSRDSNRSICPFLCQIARFFAGRATCL